MGQRGDEATASSRDAPSDEQGDLSLVQPATYLIGWNQTRCYKRDRTPVHELLDHRPCLFSASADHYDSDVSDPCREFICGSRNLRRLRLAVLRDAEHGDREG